MRYRFPSFTAVSAVIAAAATFASGRADAQVLAPTTFTYQGRLTNSGAAATGSFDMEFTLWSAASGGTQIGSAVTLPGVSVASGLFTAPLNFAGAPFTGFDRWLQIRVKPAGGPTYTLLSPRQEITPTPYATYALGPWETVTGQAYPQNGFYLRAGDASYFGMDSDYGDLHINGGNDGNVGIVSEGIPSGSFNILSGGLTRFTINNGTGNVGINTPAPLGSKMSVIADAGGSFAITADGPSAGTGVYGSTVSGRGVEGAATSGMGVRGSATSGTGVYGISSTFNGVHGQTAGSGAAGVEGFNTSATGKGGYFAAEGFGAVGNSTAGVGLQGQSTDNYGVAGYSVNSTAVHGESTGFDGVYGSTTANGHAGVAGVSSSNGNASYGGFFSGGTYGVFGAANQASGFGGYFTNGAGGVALKANGLCQVNTLQILGGSDLAEPFDVAQGADQPTIEPGMVVVIDPAHPGDLKLSTEAYDTKVAGIISGANNLAPGMVMKAIGQEHADGAHPVAMSGRVWCWVDASTTPVTPGDMLTTSTIPGTAMKAGDASQSHGAVIGKAMTGLKDGRGLVLVLVNLQ